MSLSPEQLEDKLDEFLDPVLSFRRTAAGPARKLAAFPQDIQDYILHQVQVISATNAEMAFQFSDFFNQAYHLLQQDLQQVQQWVDQAMRAYDEKGLMPAMKILQGVENYAQKIRRYQQGVTFEQQHKLLETLICGFSGRPLKLRKLATDQTKPYTDSEKIYLPALCCEFADPVQNFLLYKTMAIFLWAQNRYGSLHLELPLFAQNIPQNSHNHAELQLFTCLENIRLLSLIARDLPGFYRQSHFLHQPVLDLQYHPKWQDIYSQLTLQPDARQSMALAQQYATTLIPVTTAYQWVFQPEQVRAVSHKRILQEKTLFKKLLGELVQEKAPDTQAAENANHHLDIHLVRDEDNQDIHMDLFINGDIVALPQEMQSLLESIIQDMGNLPPDYLQPAGPGTYRARESEPEKASVWEGVYHEEDAFFYDEWDLLRQNYRKNWCVVREMSVPPVYDDFVSQTREKYHGLIKSIKRTFEALRGEQRLLKKQNQGDDLDFDALVDAWTDLYCGKEMPQQLYTKMQKEERHIAVIFMVDMSGSTEGWINQAERESLILLAEALETLGDRYAIYGFSGIARKRCEIYRVKRFDEPYNDEVKARISGISAKDYTRMGFAIRHLSGILQEQEAKTRLLITLSDGKPEDYDGQYRGAYGIEDTRQALFEAKQKGIHAFCITIDEQAGDYLPHMYGAANFTQIDQVEKLPLKVSEIYRRITTK